MTQPVSQTQQCPNCGHPNDISRALCENCQTPLTAYSGQLRGEAYQGRLAAIVERQSVRPPSVAAMTLFHILFAVFWPLAFVVLSFAQRQTVNSEGTNYIGAAMSAVGPFFALIVLVPFALALFGLAFAVWTQRPWAWTASLVTLGLFALRVLSKFPAAPIISIVWLAVAGGLLVFWLRPETKAWYGVD